MKTIHLEPLPYQQTSNECVRRCRISRFDNQTHIDSTELWFRFDKSINPPAVDDCDSYLLAVIMDAMKENRDLILYGSVSRQLLSNLVEYQAAWNKWLPAVYHCVDIQPDEIRENVIPIRGAVCAFSGGIDATFSVWRHMQNKNSYRTQQINFCSIVHGFDIHLKDHRAFTGALNQAQKVVGDFGLRLEPISTNCRNISRVSWPDAFSCALAATLGNFKNHAGTCIIGSSEPYNSLVFPLGSSPITDHLLSSGDFIVLHDGASHSRTEKVKEIATWRIGVDNLRVCWQGALKDRNCGTCEKCLRTKLNFLVTNNPIPSCFPDTDIIRDLKNVTFRSDAIRAEWRQIYEYAKENNLSAPWVKQLAKTLKKRKPVFQVLLPYGSIRREQLKKLKLKFSWR